MSSADEESELRRTVVLRGENRVLPGFEASTSNVKWQSPFFFIQAADTQLGLIEHYGDGAVGAKYPDVTWEREIELCEQSVDILNAMEPKPRFFIVCGDLVDAMPDQVKSKKNMNHRQ